MRLLILGLDNAGKTTILKRFNGEDIHTISPTLGFNIKTLEHRGSSLIAGMSVGNHLFEATGKIILKRLMGWYGLWIQRTAGDSRRAGRSSTSCWVKSDLQAHHCLSLPISRI